MVYLRGGPPSALPWRNYGCKMRESLEKLSASKGRTPGRIEGLECRIEGLEPDGTWPIRRLPGSLIS